MPIDCSLRYLQTSGERDCTPAAPFNPFLHHPQCYLDILYLHLKGNEEKEKCQEVFDKLVRLTRFTHLPGNQGRISNLEPFVLETCASAIKLGSHMAALMAHPAQREEVWKSPWLHTSSSYNCTSLMTFTYIFRAVVNIE